MTKWGFIRRVLTLKLWFIRLHRWVCSADDHRGVLLACESHIICLRSNNKIRGGKISLHIQSGLITAVPKTPPGHAWQFHLKTRVKRQIETISFFFFFERSFMIHQSYTAEKPKRWSKLSFSTFFLFTISLCVSVQPAKLQIKRWSLKLYLYINLYILKTQTD